MKRVLLTGIGGSVGSLIFSYIMNETDWEVVGLDSFSHKGYRDRLDRLFKEQPGWKKRLTMFQTNLESSISDSLIKGIGNIDYILHLAALSDVFFSIENPEFVIKNNINSTITMLEYAKKTPHESFIYFSTDEVYGPTEKGKAHKEWDMHRPSNAYSASKAACEDICYAYWRAGFVKLIITNTMNNYGPMQSSSKFPVMIQKWVANDEKVVVHGNEESIGTRFYIHSWDTADAVVWILKNRPPYLHKTGELDEPDRYHIVGEGPISNLDLAQRIADLMGKELKYELVDFHKDNPAHDIHYGLEDNKLRSSGWKPTMTLNQGLFRTIKWQKKNPEWIV